MNKVELAKQLVEEKTGKDGKCTLSKKKLGELLHSRYPAEFRTAENGRSAVRLLTGSTGGKMRKAVKNRIEWKGLALPEPEKHDWSKFIIKESRIGILSDIHFPYYDKKALDTAISYLRKWKPECIVLNGDIIDMYQLSRFEKDPRKRGFKYELDMLNAFILELKKYFKDTRIIYVQGNHEVRYEAVILQRVPEFVDLEWTKFDYVIKAKEHGIDYVDGKRLLMAGKLNIGHGHEMPMGIAAPVNPARGFFLKTKANFLGGHHHQVSEHTEGDINDNQTGAWSTGCLCELHPRYMPINKWSHGFATVKVEKGGAFLVNNLKIINGRIL